MSNQAENQDARQTAEQVFRRDRRRIRALATVTIGLWVVAALLITSVYLPLGAKLKYYARMIDAANPGASDLVIRDATTQPVIEPVPADQVPQVLAQVRHQNWIVAQIVIHEWLVGAIIMVMALATGILASVSTVALALFIRRVTLRQVSEQLAEISLQLRAMRGPGTA